MIEERLEGNELEFKVDEGEFHLAEWITKQLACLQHKSTCETVELTI